MGCYHGGHLMLRGQDATNSLKSTGQLPELSHPAQNAQSAEAEKPQSKQVKNKMVILHLICSNYFEINAIGNLLSRKLKRGFSGVHDILNTGMDTG